MRTRRDHEAAIAAAHQTDQDGYGTDAWVARRRDRHRDYILGVAGLTAEMLDADARGYLEHLAYVGDPSEIAGVAALIDAAAGTAAVRTIGRAEGLVDGLEAGVAAVASSARLTDEKLRALVSVLGVEELCVLTTAASPGTHREGTEPSEPAPRGASRN